MVHRLANGMQLKNTLPQGEAYKFRVRAVNAAVDDKDKGKPSYEVMARPNDRGGEGPGMPRNVTAVANEDGSVTLAWTAPVSNGGSPVTGYEYLADPEALTDTGNVHCGGCTWTSTENTATSVTVTHRNGTGPDRGERLENGQLYAFAVRAINERGRSWVSNRAWTTPQGGAEGAQSAPPEEPAPAPLTASLVSAPDSHDGEDAFRVQIAFSDTLRNSYRTLDEGFAVSGGAITGVRRVEGTRDVARLERRLGGRLFERIPTGMRLTALGAVAAERARRILHEVEAADRAMDAARAGRTGVIRIADPRLASLAAMVAAATTPSIPGFRPPAADPAPLSPAAPSPRPRGRTRSACPIPHRSSANGRTPRARASCHRCRRPSHPPLHPRCGSAGSCREASTDRCFR